VLRNSLKAAAARTGRAALLQALLLAACPEELGGVLGTFALLSPRHFKGGLESYFRVAMPRTPAAYVSRLNAVLRACAELAASEGFVTAQRLAEAVGVTERMARVYLVDLLELGVLEYAGGGRYRLSAGSAGLLERWEAVGEELSVEGVVLGDPRREAVSYMLEKAYRIGEAVASLGRREELRRKLLSLSPPEGRSGEVFHVEEEKRPKNLKPCAQHQTTLAIKR